MELTDKERRDIYMEVHYPSIQELEFYKKNCEDDETMKAIDLKLAAAKAVPTTLEQNMSAEQLFELGCPIWVRPYSIYELTFIISMWESIGDEQFKKLLGQATDYETLASKLIDATMQIAYDNIQTIYDNSMKEIHGNE